MNILTFKYDPKKGGYTNEVEQIPMREFVIRFCSRWPIHDTRQLIANMSDDDVLDFCDKYGIGVRKVNYLAAGMSESEYRQVYKSLTAVRKELTRNRSIRRWGSLYYSIREYLAYASTREQIPQPTMKDILNQQNPSRPSKKLKSL